MRIFYFVVLEADTQNETFHMQGHEKLCQKLVLFVVIHLVLGDSCLVRKDVQDILCTINPQKGFLSLTSGLDLNQKKGAEIKRTPFGVTIRVILKKVDLHLTIYLCFRVSYQ